MNKKLFFGMLAAAGMVVSTSCSEDELDVIQAGSDAQVTISLGLEGGMGTRAISDGKSADKLVYAVYDANKQLISTIATVEKTGVVFPTTETISLAKGQEYTVVFWAQDSDCDAYTVTTEADGIKVAVDYSGANNDESRDAFFKAETFEVTGDDEINVTLKRPFAQINVGVTEEDWNAAAASGIDVIESKVEIKNAANAINLLDGTVSGSVAVEYDFATIPAKFTEEDVLKVDIDKDGAIGQDETFKYLSMSYILPAEELTGAGKTTLEADGLKFTFKPQNGQHIVFDEALQYIPVQRNWRTNILGKILTGNVELKIVIDERYDGDNNFNDGVQSSNEIAPGVVLDGNTYRISSAAGLVWLSEVVNGTAVATAENGYDANHVAANNFYRKTVVLTNDVDMTNVTWTPISMNRRVGGDGLGQCFSGTFDGGDHTISNLTVTSDGYAGLFASAVGTIKNVKMTNVNVAGAVDAAAVVGYIYGSVENCHVDGGKVAANVQNGDNGIHAAGIVGYMGEGNNVIKKCSVKNLEITAYSGVAGIVGCANSGSSITDNVVDKVTIVANQLVNYNKSGVNAYADKVIGRNLTGATVSDSNITNNVTVTVYTMDTATSTATVESDEQISFVIKSGIKNITLAPGTYIIPDEAAGKTLSFIGLTGEPEDVKIATQDDGSYEGCDYSLDGATVTFENISINTDSRTYTGYARCNGTYKNCVINGTYTLYGKSVFEQCEFNISGDLYNIWTWGAGEATFDTCTFNCDGKAVLVYNSNLNITFNTCTFNDNGGISGKAAIETGVDNGNTKYTININNSKVNGFDVTGKNTTTYGGTSLGTNVWGNKNLITADNLDVIIDGTEVY